MEGETARDQKTYDGIAVAGLLVLLLLCASRLNGGGYCGTCCGGGCCKQPMALSPATYSYMRTRGPVDPEALDQAVNTVNALVTSQLEQYQFDALVDFCYTIGPCAFAASDVLAEVNSCDYTAAAQALAFSCVPQGRTDACLFNGTCA